MLRHLAYAYIYTSIIHEFICFRFCPSVFFYLCTVIPSVWFLELDLAERRSNFNVTEALGLIPVAQRNILLDNDDTLPVKMQAKVFVLDRLFC